MRAALSTLVDQLHTVEASAADAALAEIIIDLQHRVLDLEGEASKD